MQKRSVVTRAGQQHTLLFLYLSICLSSSLVSSIPKRRAIWKTLFFKYFARKKASFSRFKLSVSFMFSSSFSRLKLSQTCKAWLLAQPKILSTGDRLNKPSWGYFYNLKLKPFNACILFSFSLFFAVYQVWCVCAKFDYVGPLNLSTS